MFRIRKKRLNSENILTLLAERNNSTVLRGVNIWQDQSLIIYYLQQKQQECKKIMLPKVLCLDSVREALNHLRSSKKRVNEGIPVYLWKQIITFAPHPIGARQRVTYMDPANLSNGVSFLRHN